MHTMEMNERTPMGTKSDQIDHDNEVNEDGSFLSNYEQHQRTIGMDMSYTKHKGTPLFSLVKSKWYYEWI